MSKREKNIYHMGENKKDDLKNILSFDSEMSSVYSENDNSFLTSDTK